MGKQAGDFFQQAERIGGLAAKARLAALARVTSTEAAAMPDAPEMLSRLQVALDEVRALRHKQPAKRAALEGDIVPARSGTRETELLRLQIGTVAELMAQRALFLGEVEKTVRRIDEAAASTLDIERVSVWSVDAARSKIVCLDLFERSAGKHSSGTELHRKDFEPYFAALESERTIAAHDAHTDPRTSCFSKTYLSVLGINSMLDVPIWVRGAMAGVICHEHVGPPRKWNTDEESFASLMAIVVALSMERR